MNILVFLLHFGYIAGTLAAGFIIGYYAGYKKIDLNKIFKKEERD